ncbi:MAG: lactonase family protein [Flavitalea sp.]
MKRLFAFALAIITSNLIMSQDYKLIAGTYTNGDSKGIYVLKFNPKTAAITPLSVTTGVENPSYLAVSKNEQFVYAVNENGGDKPGEVSAFSFNKKAGTLTFLNKQQTSGDHPCYVSIDNSGKWVFTANYSGGNFAVLPVNADGSLGKAAQVVDDNKLSTDPKLKAHVHSTIFTPDQKYLLVPDLGLEKIFVYKFNPAGRQPLTPADQPFISFKAGHGPRHVSFHPRLPYMYCISENSGTVSSYSYNDGKFTELQDLSSHPDGFQGTKGSADIHVSPDGKFVYATNRGDANSIAIFAIDQVTGKISLKGIQSTEGKHPRNFTIDPTGNFLLVANRDSNNIVVFAIDRKTGLLKLHGKPYNVPNPVYLGLVK